MTYEHTSIQRFARLCAERGLDLRAAKNLFTAIYLADALLIENNHRSNAAKRAGTQRAIFYQRKVKDEERLKCVTGQEDLE